MKNYQNKPVQSESTPQTQPVPVTKYMVRARDLITFKPDTEILSVVDTLLDNRITGAPVLDDKNKLVGLIDDKDCLKVLFDSSYHNQPVDKKTVANYMTNTMRTVNVNADIFDVANIFLSSKYKRLLVVNDAGDLVGQISRHDILQAIHDINQNAR